MLGGAARIREYGYMWKEAWLGLDRRQKVQEPHQLTKGVGMKVISRTTVFNRSTVLLEELETLDNNRL